LRKKYGFQIYQCHGKEATLESITAILSDLNKKLTENDNLIIFFSGHGLSSQITGNTSDGYWIPVQGKQKNAHGAISSYIPNSRIKDFISSYIARHILVISDACFSASLVEKTKGPDEDENTIYDELSRKKSRQAFTAGLGPVPDSSEFSKWLIHYLNTNTKKSISARSIFTQAHLPVEEKYLHIDKGRIPVKGIIEGVGDAGGDLIFNLVE